MDHSLVTTNILRSGNDSIVYTWASVARKKRVVPKRATAGNALNTNSLFCKITAGTCPPPTAFAPQVQVPAVTVVSDYLALDHRNVHMLTHMHAHAAYKHLGNALTCKSVHNKHPYTQAHTCNKHVHLYNPTQKHILAMHTWACICNTYLYI